MSHAEREAFGVYVHWPFCLSKCPYCDFNSHVRENFDSQQWGVGLRSDMRHAPDRRANHPTVDEFACCLPASTKKGVGGVANHQPLFGGKIKDAPPILKCGCERFFRIDMFAGCQRGHADLCMNSWNCQVQDAVDAVIGDDVRRACYLGNVILRGLQPALFKIKAATGSDTDFRE